MASRKSKLNVNVTKIPSKIGLETSDKKYLFIMGQRLNEVA